MDSNLLARIHSISVMLFLLTYVIKTILLFSSRTRLEKYSAMTKIPEMVVSLLFFVTGIWLFIILDGIKTFQIVKLIFVFASIPLAVIGFKKYKKGLALISLFLIIGAYGLAEMSKNKPFIPKKVELASGGDLSIANGAVIYQSNCVFCHGNDGKKMYRNAPDLTQSKLNEDAIIQMIREGGNVRGKMPSYNIIMSDENMRAVAKYVMNFHPLDTNVSNDTISQ
jgi:mono/diheme cytochrome c family protein